MATIMTPTTLIPTTLTNMIPRAEALKENELNTVGVQLLDKALAELKKELERRHYNADRMKRAYNLICILIQKNVPCLKAFENFGIKELFKNNFVKSLFLALVQAQPRNQLEALKPFVERYNLDYDRTFIHLAAEHILVEPKFYHLAKLAYKWGGCDRNNKRSNIYVDLTAFGVFLRKIADLSEAALPNDVKRHVIAFSFFLAELDGFQVEGRLIEADGYRKRCKNALMTELSNLLILFHVPNIKQLAENFYDKIVPQLDILVSKNTKATDRHGASKKELEQLLQQQFEVLMKENPESLKAAVSIFSEFLTELEPEIVKENRVEALVEATWKELLKSYLYCRRGIGRAPKGKNSADNKDSKESKEVNETAAADQGTIDDGLDGGWVDVKIGAELKKAAERGTGDNTGTTTTNSQSKAMVTAFTLSTMSTGTSSSNTSTVSSTSSASNVSSNAGTSTATASNSSTAAVGTVGVSTTATASSSTSQTAPSQ